MQHFEIGTMVRSKAGHDKDKIFVVIREQGEFVEIADGKGRTVEKPKRKKKKHLQPILYIDPALLEKLQENRPFLNEDIKYAIKHYTGGHEPCPKPM